MVKFRDHCSLILYRGRGREGDRCKGGIVREGEGESPELNRLFVKKRKANSVEFANRMETDEIVMLVNRLL